MAFYILIDTGTTNTRVSLLDENWQCVEQTGEAVGVHIAAANKFFFNQLAAYAEAADTRIQEICDSLRANAADCRHGNIPKRPSNRFDIGHTQRSRRKQLDNIRACIVRHHDLRRSQR